MTEKDKPKPPKGGRKGGTLFPRVDLKKAVEYSKKIASKTHAAPQPESVILPGVFNNNGPDGKVRASALRQFGLLNEDKEKMKGTELASDILSSPEDEIGEHLQKAFLTPKLFKQLFETFKGDTVSQAKLRQQALKLKVHPDTVDECIGIFTNSMVFCGLGKSNGDNFDLMLPGAAIKPLGTGAEESDLQEGEGDNGPEDSSMKKDNDATEASQQQIKKPKLAANFQVNINLDPSMDPEKLEKLMKVLRNYGAI